MPKIVETPNSGSDFEIEQKAIALIEKSQFLFKSLFIDLCNKGLFSNVNGHCLFMPAADKFEDSYLDVVWTDLFNGTCFSRIEYIAKKALHQLETEQAKKTKTLESVEYLNSREILEWFNNPETKSEKGYQIAKVVCKTSTKCINCGNRIHFNFLIPDLIYKPENIENEEETVCEYSEKIYTQKIEIKDSAVYFFDWFRYSAFTNKLRSCEQLSINYKLGRIKESQHYALFNLAKWQVGNSSPSVYSSDNEIVIGRLLEEGLFDRATDTVENSQLLKRFENKSLQSIEQSGLKEKGYVCTDLWAACIIDHESLKEVLISSNLSDTQAESMIADNARYMGTLQIDPGIYEMEFAHEGHAFEKLLNKPKYRDFLVYGRLKKIK